MGGKGRGRWDGREGETAPGWEPSGGEGVPLGGEGRRGAPGWESSGGEGVPISCGMPVSCVRGASRERREMCG